MVCIILSSVAYVDCEEIKCRRNVILYYTVIFAKYKSLLNRPKSVNELFSHRILGCKEPHRSSGPTFLSKNCLVY